MKKNLFFKTTSLLVAFSILYSQLLWAADVRQMLAKANQTFENEDTRRGSGSSPDSLLKAQAQQEALVQNQNILSDLQNPAQFSLTTQNGDILTYVNGQLNQVVTRPDDEGNSATLTNISVDEDGNIQDAAID